MDKEKSYFISTVIESKCVVLFYTSTHRRNSESNWFDLIEKLEEIGVVGVAQTRPFAEAWAKGFVYLDNKKNRNEQICDGDLIVD